MKSFYARIVSSLCKCKQSQWKIKSRKSLAEPYENLAPIFVPVMLLICDAYNKIDFDFRRFLGECKSVNGNRSVCVVNDLYDGMSFDWYEGAKIRFSY